MASQPDRERAALQLEAIAPDVACASADDCLDAAFADIPEIPPSRLVTAIGSVSKRRGRAPLMDAHYFARIARWLGCRFADSFEGLAGADVPLRLGHQVCDGLRFEGPEGSEIAISPPPSALPALGRLSCVKPELMRKVIITTPAALKAARATRLTVESGRIAPLHAIPRPMLADRVATRVQVIATVAALSIMAVLMAGAPFPALSLVLIAVNLALLAHAATRGIALLDRTAPRATRRPRTARAGDETLPVYSVLIPLYREAGIVPQLVQSIGALDYPADRLDIQFLVEADDTATREALERHAAHLFATITVVPAGGPKTKPKALNVGLRRARGSLITVYDAEDRPDPQQLRLAAAAFRDAPRTLAALQARLIIDHAGETWLTSMFAIEYAVQFDAILPMLARRDALFLLGGTSNHFRLSALAEVGGWDPYNVTEDADLAVRLKRAGYQIGTLASQTFEEAPLTLRAWLKQRTRWGKGWMQTWLVHMRSPIRLVRELGLVDTLLLQTFILGGFLAVLAHPVFLVALLVYAFDSWSPATDQLVGTITFAASIAIFVLGYGATFCLGAILIRRRGLSVSPWVVAGFPLYWFLLFAALVAAVWELCRRPHHWAKTQHGLARRPQIGLGAPVAIALVAPRKRHRLAARQAAAREPSGRPSLIDLRKAAAPAAPPAPERVP